MDHNAERYAWVHRSTLAAIPNCRTMLLTCRGADPLGSPGVSQQQANGIGQARRVIRLDQHAGTAVVDDHVGHAVNTRGD